MSIPNHRASCQSGLVPMNCQDCGDQVWLLWCTWGSRVFFDLDGPPWPRHDARCIEYRIRLLLQDGVSAAKIRYLVRDFARAKKLPIPPGFNQKLAGMENKVRTGSMFNEVMPNNQEYDICGRIVEVNNHASFLIVRAMKESYMQITIRTNQDERTQIADQFQVFISSRNFAKSGLKLWDRVFAVLTPFEVYEYGRVWLCDTIEEE